VKNEGLDEGRKSQGSPISVISEIHDDTGLGNLDEDDREWRKILLRATHKMNLKPHEPNSLLDVVGTGGGFGDAI
jgi:16S rRNA G527 N7-methylase RsmG